jgi:hypothetical protein
MLNYQNIYRRDHKENLRIFSDLKGIKEYSSYNIDLNRIFGDNSYNKFHKNLFEGKTINNDNVIKMFQKPFKPTSFKKYEENFSLDQFEKSLNNMKTKDEILNYKIKNPFIERMKNSPMYLFKKEVEKNKNTSINLMKPLIPEVPEVGRYNPQYNSINKHSFMPFFGDIPSRRYHTIENEILKNNNNSKNNKNNDGNSNLETNYDIDSELNNHNYNLKSKSINKYNHYYIKKQNNNIYNSIKIDNYKNDRREDKSEKIFSINSRNNISFSNISDNNSINNSFNLNNSPIKDNSKRKRISSGFKSNISIDNNLPMDADKEKEKELSLDNSIKTRGNSNYSIKVGVYTPKKQIDHPNIHNSNFKNELPNYYTPKYTKNTINFNKGNNSLSYIDKIIIDKNKYPPLGFYEPKYNYIFNSINKNIYLDKNSSLENTPKNRLKQIFSKYRITRDYETVPSLNCIETQSIKENNNN